MKASLKINSRVVWVSVLIFILSSNVIQAQWVTDPRNPNLIYTRDRVGIGTNQDDSKAQLHLDGGLKLGSQQTLPIDRWNDRVITLTSTGILGSQGSFGVSMAWNGYRRSANAGGGWAVTGTGHNGELRNVGSFEINNNGMFWYYDKNPEFGFNPTPRLSIDTKGIVNVQEALSVGTSALPTDRWSKRVIGVGPAGILGTQGAYGLSMAWNGYRSNGNGAWKSIGTGVDGSLKNVGSIEMKNEGIFLNFDANPSDEFTPTPRLSIDTTGTVNAKEALRVGTSTLPTDRWSKRVIGVGPVGILGTQGSYGLSMAWNGYRSKTNGVWKSIGTGVDGNLKNVGSIEMKNEGIFLNFDTNPSDEFTPTPRLSIDTTGTVNAKEALRVGTSTLPADRWSKRVIGVGSVGIIGSQGSYGLSMAWNGYRSNANGKWKSIGTGVNRNINNVGSIEMRNEGIFFNFDNNPTSEFDPTRRMIIGNNGNVGIGIDPQSDFKLAVSGNIICEELQVELSQNWPDYVFGDDYQLMPLEEVKVHIDTNKHLPGIPKASELEANGLAIGEMQRLMMEKIEELTLYMIDLKRENEALKIRLEQLEK